MANFTKRQMLAAGAVLLVGAAGAGYLVTGGAKAGGVDYTFLTVDEMKKDGGLIVDIRTPPEWQQTGVIEGAELVTFDPRDPAGFLAKIGPQIADGRDLILICRSGNRSSAAAKILEGKIPNRIISINGGMQREIAGGYKTVPPR